MKRAAIFLMCLSLVSGAVVLLSGCKDKSDSSANHTMDNMADHAQNSADTMPVADTAAADADTEQKICPVMKNPIDKNVYVEYEGKKVYFCCESCKAEFAKNPEKYIKDLPQFN